MKLLHGDCLELMKELPDNSVDMVLTDLPYGGGVTDCSWDKRLNLAVFWAEVRRILKPLSSAVMFASGKFTHELIASNLEMFKYKWIWVKNAPTNFVHAKNAPMHKYEEICIFSDGIVQHANLSDRRMKYFPQSLVKFDEPKVRSECKTKVGGIFQKHTLNRVHEVVAKNYPTDILYFDVVFNGKRLHPSQKPVKLLEYLIRTYTKEGEVVLDATMGSGSTGVACVNTDRDFIGIEMDEEYFRIASERIDKAIKERDFNGYCRGSHQTRQKSGGYKSRPQLRLF